MLRSRVLAGALALAGVALGALPTPACTTVCLLEKGRAVVAYNYDFDPSDGLVVVNKRDTIRRSRLQGTSWVARHGSVTFNQFGRDQPTTGLNEKGLMVSLMWLDETRYPPADDRPALGILEWIQYHLDRHASVAEVIANAEAARPTGRVPIHYFFADAGGDAAAVEFLDGKLVVHRGASLPVKALANSTYADSVTALETARQAGRVPTSSRSLDRFVRGATLATGEGDLVARGFAVLAAVAQASYTRWSIVYDLSAGAIHFKTDTNPGIRSVTMAGLDFSCPTPVKVLDVTAPGSGDVTRDFADYTRAMNHALMESSLRQTPRLGNVPAPAIAAAAAHPDATSTCAE